MFKASGVLSRDIVTRCVALVAPSSDAFDSMRSAFAEYDLEIVACRSSFELREALREGAGVVLISADCSDVQLRTVLRGLTAESEFADVPLLRLGGPREPSDHVEFGEIISVDATLDSRALVAMIRCIIKSSSARVHEPTRTMEQNFKAAIDTAMDAMIGLGEDGSIQFANSAAERMFGYSRGELLRCNIDRLIAVHDAVHPAETIASCLAQPYSAAILDRPVEARRKNGSCFLATLSVGELHSGGQRQFMAVVRDFTQVQAVQYELTHLNQNLEHRVQQRTALLRLLQNIAFAANLADRIEEAMAYALMRICRQFNWSFGCAYLASPDSQVFTILDAFYGDQPSRFDALRRDLAMQCIPRDKGLLGKVVSEGKPIWTDNLADLEATGLASACGIADLEAAAGFPVLVENRVVAVLVFLPARPVDLDSRSLDAMAAIGAQLGNLIERKQAEAHLRSSEERFHAVFQNAAIGIALVEMGYGGRLLRTNRALNQMLGYGAYELNQSSMVELCHPDDLEKSFKLHHELLEGGRSSYQIEARLRAHDSRTVWGRLMVSLIRSKSGSPVTTVLLVEDITDRKQAQDELRRISLSLEHAREGIAHVSNDGRYTAANRAYAEILGVKPEDLIGSSWESTFGPAQLGAARETLEHLRVSGKANFAGRSVGADGLARDYHAVLYRSADDELAGYYCFLEDITHRKRLEREITDAVVDRQRRIGQELQEGLIQQLTGIRMMARNLRQQLEERQGPELALAEDFSRLIADAQAQAKVIIKGLRPVEVDAGGLMAALQELAISTERRFGITCAFEAQQDVPVEDNDTATQLFYIAQEAITYAVKRQPASGIVIRLRLEAGKLVMSVSENGHGIAGRVVDASGMNARIMHYRAALIGAKLEISSADDGGAAVTCTM